MLVDVGGKQLQISILSLGCSLCRVSLHILFISPVVPSRFSCFLFQKHTSKLVAYAEIAPR